MTATTLETAPFDAVEDAAEPTLGELVDDSLAFVEKLSDEEMDRALSKLIMCAKTLELPAYVKARQINQYIEAIPSVADLLEKIHDTADYILQHEELDAEAILVVSDLGVAADVTQDPELLEQTIRAIDDTQDLSMDMMKRAMVIAKDKEKLFIDVYRDLKAGKPVVAATVQHLPMHAKPDFLPTDVLSPYLSTREFPLQEKSAHSVTMDGYGDLFGDTRPDFAPIEAHHFTEQHIGQTTTRLAMNEFIEQSKRRRA